MLVCLKVSKEDRRTLSVGSVFNCIVSTWDMAEDVFSLQLITDDVLNVFTACVALNNKIGGRTRIGPIKIFSVGVKGKWFRGDA